jgi:hypothetical protein
MKKCKAMKPAFKVLNMGQMQLMPQSYEEMIREGHLVRVVNREE